MPMRKLKNYKPTRFMAESSHYSKEMADYAVLFIESLCHTKGTWAGKKFELIDWQEQIIRDRKSKASRSLQRLWHFCCAAVTVRNEPKSMAVPPTDSRPPLCLMWPLIWCGCVRL